MNSSTAAAVEELISDLAADTTDPPAGCLPPVWTTMVDLGLDGIGIEEAAGGSGGTLDDLVDVVLSCGRNGLSSPLVEHSTARWVTGPGDVRGLAVIAVDDAPADGPTEFPGRTWAVPWARHATTLLVVDPTGVRSVDLRAGGPAVAPGLNEAGEPTDLVSLGSVSATILPAAPDPTAVRNRLGLLRAAALVGATQGAYRTTRNHVRTREQFGAPLIRIPAVATNLAALKAELVQAEAVLDGARQAAAQDLSSTACTAAVAAARVVTARTATAVARGAHQLHGAIGITAEYPLHRHTKRLWAWRDGDRPERAWALQLGSLAAAEGEAFAWHILTSPYHMGLRTR